MANYEKQLHDLGQVWDYLGKSGIVDTLTEEEQKRAYAAYATGYSYYEQYFDVYHKNSTPAFTRDPRVIDPQSFREYVSQTEVQQIRDFFEHLSHESTTDNFQIPEVVTEVPINFLKSDFLAQNNPFILDGQAEIDIYLRKVQVKAKAEIIPRFIDLDLSQLKKTGDYLNVRDLQISAGVEVLNNPNQTIVILREINQQTSSTKTPDKKKDETEDLEKKLLAGPQPPKEDSTVPVEINELVSELKNKQAEELTSNKKYSVSDAIKKARATWSARHRAEVIRENRLALIQDKSAREQQREIEDLDRDLFLIKSVNPKADSARVLTQNIERVSRQAVIAQAANLGIGLTNSQINRAVEDLVYAGLSGAVDYTNFQDLNIVTDLAFKNQGIKTNSPINEIDAAIIAEEQELQENPYSEKPDQLEEFIRLKDSESRKYIENSSKHLYTQLNKENPDIKDNLEAATNEQQKIVQALLVAVPDPQNTNVEKTNPLSQNLKPFEAALRQVDPTLKINESPLGAQTSGLLKQVNGGSREISPEVIHLAAIGLTPEKLAKAEEFAKNNPNSPIGKLYSTHKDVFAQVHFQINQLRKTKLGEEIEKSITPLNTLTGTITNIYNKVPVKAVGVILDPVGSAKSWAGRAAGRQIGKRLVEYSNQELVKKLGGYLLNNGLQGGIKAFTKAVSKEALAKLATWAALKLGISMSLESLNAIIPGLGVVVDIAVQAALYIGEKTIGALYKGFQSAAETIYGEKIKARDLLAPLVFLGGAAASAGAAAFGGIVIIIRTAQVAIVSAAGVIIGSVAVIGLYLGFAYLVAPMLSTLVQLDGKEKVKYEAYETTATASSDCAWPTKGHYQVIEGPDAGTHHLSHLQAIDIWAGNINGTDTVSSTDGIVVTAGPYSNYGNTIIIQTSNKAGTFKVAYGHMGSMAVGVGQKVKQGQKIGTVGSTKLFPSPHIHFEYIGIKYNQCPAGGKKIPDGCADFVKCGSVYTN